MIDFEVICDSILGEVPVTGNCIHLLTYLALLSKDCIPAFVHTDLCILMQAGWLKTFCVLPEDDQVNLLNYIYQGVNLSSLYEYMLSKITQQLVRAHWQSYK